MAINLNKCIVEEVALTRLGELGGTADHDAHFRHPARHAAAEAAERGVERGGARFRH